MSAELEESLKQLKTRLLQSPGAYCHVPRARINEASNGLPSPTKKLLPVLIETGFLKKLSREFYRIERASA